VWFRGFVIAANLPFTWDAQPHKGLIYFNDINSGLWVVKLGGEDRLGINDRAGAVRHLPGNDSWICNRGVKC
jgi:hypothetical protein